MWLYATLLLFASCCFAQQTPFTVQDGFAFTNSWPHVPAIEENTPLGRITLGDASNGLCGGMVFTALDFFYAQMSVPSSDKNPGSQSPLFKYIVRRLIDSWDLPIGVVQYYQWMNFPDSDETISVFGHTITVRRGIAWHTVQQQWPDVRKNLDSGLPVPLGLVTVKSSDPRQLSRCHQVLARGYTIQTDNNNGDTVVVLHVYDPNSGQRQTHITFSISHPTQQTEFSHNVNIAEPIRGFFVTPYTPSQPPTFG